MRSGEVKTTTEWVRELFPDVSYHNGRKALALRLRSLHKQGHLIFPIQFGKGKGASWVIKYCNDDETLLSKVYNHRISDVAEANLVSSMRLAERYIFAFPESRQKVIARAKELIHLAVEQEKHLLGIRYEPAKSLGHFQADR